jgi:hypothetical protein
MFADRSFDREFGASLEMGANDAFSATVRVESAT